MVMSICYLRLAPPIVYTPVSLRYQLESWLHRDCKYFRRHPIWVIRNMFSRVLLSNKFLHQEKDTFFVTDNPHLVVDFQNNIRLRI